MYLQDRREGSFFIIIIIIIINPCFQFGFGVIVFNATFGVENRRTRKITTDLSQVTDKLYHIMLFELTTLVVIGTEHTCSCSIQLFNGCT